MSCVTTTSSALGNHVATHLEYIEHLPRIYCDGVDTGFPCPNQLLEAIIYINHLRSSSHVKFGNGTTQIDSRVEDLLKRITYFSPSSLTQFQRQNYSCTDDPSTLTAAGHQGNDLLALISAFQTAVLLYCIRTLILDRGYKQYILHIPSPTCDSDSILIDISSLHSTSITMLLEHLHHLLSPKTRRREPWLGKFLFWPLFVAGMECTYSSSFTFKLSTMAAEKEFIARSLCEIACVQGDLSAYDAALFLRNIWRMQDPNDGVNSNNGDEDQMSWDDKVALLERRALFMI
jgi:hypothetical protein